MDPPLFGKLLLALFFLGANAFFVAAEFALVRARRDRIQEMMEHGDRLARAVHRAREDLDRSISGTQLGITMASLGLGWIGEPAIAAPLAGAFQGLAEPWSAVATHGVAVALAFALLTFLHIILGELVPRTAGLARPESVSRVVALPLNLFNRVTAPAIRLVNGAAGLVIRAAGWPSAGDHEHARSPEEIQMMLRESFRRDEVEQEEEAMIHGVFELPHTVAREVMTPRTDIVAVPDDATLEEVLKAAAESGFSRLPVFRESIDDIVGVLLVKDLLPWFRRDRTGAFGPAAVARAAYFVPESKSVDDLLAELRREKVHLAVVVDEFGGTDGIVTLEDVIEEVVGEIYDEHDIARAEIRVDAGGRILVEGSTPLSDLLERYEIPCEEPEYDSVAGYVIGQLGRIPEEGERVLLGESALEVLETRERRVTRLCLHSSPEAPVSSASGKREDREEPEERAV